MKTITDLHPGMGAAVLQHLRTMGDLPKKGILAGQAVDSALTDLFGAGGGVYNDLDVFRACTDKHANSRRLTANRTARRSGLSVESPKSGYGAMGLVMDLVGSYGIASVSRNGMVNYVNCNKAPSRFGAPLSADEVIAGFDINCTRVAVDLSTGLLHWDTHYEVFRRTRQLEISLMHTPWHTFMRLLKKQRELPGAFLDAELAAQACVGLANGRVFSHLKHGQHVSTLFGAKNHELALDLSSELNPYFELQAKTLAGAGGNLWQLQARAPLAPALQKKVDALGVAGLFFAAKVVKEHRRTKSVPVLRKLEALHTARGRACEEDDLDYVQACAATFETAYVEGQALPDVGAKVAAYVKKHPKFQGLLFGFSLAEQHQVILRVGEVTRGYAARHPDYLDALSLVGVLETTAAPGDLTTPERMVRLLDTRRAADSTPFNVEPLVLPDLPQLGESIVIKELLRPMDLRAEGVDLGHCVGGYSGAVEFGRSRILSIRSGPTKKDWSTVELRKGTRAMENDFSVAQHRGAGNKKAPPANEQALALLLPWLVKPAARRAKSRA